MRWRPIRRLVPCHANSGSPPARNASYSSSPSRSPPAASGSSMSMTSGRRSAFSSAGPIVGESSRSVMIAFASPCSRMKATVLASRRVLMVLTTAPSIGTARVASQAAGTLGAMTETVSPRPIPRAARPEASRRQRAVGLGPGMAAVAVDDGRAFGIDGRASFEEADGSEVGVVRGVRVEVGFVGVRAHRSSSARGFFSLRLRCAPAAPRKAAASSSGP